MTELGDRAIDSLPTFHCLPGAGRGPRLAASWCNVNWIPACAGTTMFCDCATNFLPTFSLSPPRLHCLPGAPNGVSIERLGPKIGCVAAPRKLAPGLSMAAPFGVPG